MRRVAAWLSGVGLVAAGVSLAGATPAQADCEPPSIAQAAAQSDAVFVGTTLNRVEGEENTFEVRASDIYQGSPGAFLEVTGGLHEDAAFLEADRQYLFFTRTSAGSWTALGCGATQPISSRLIAQTDRVLGQATPLRAPASPGSGSTESPSAEETAGESAGGSESGTAAGAAAQAEDGSGSRVWWWAGAGGVLLAGAGGFAYAGRRQR